MRKIGCTRKNAIIDCPNFVHWEVNQVRTYRWSLDVCVGYAKLHGLFAQTEMVCTKTLYNELAAGNLPLSLFEMPEVLKRKCSKRNSRAHKQLKGRSIDERPDIVDARTELGHWDADTVIGRKSGKEAVILTLVERVTNNFIAIRIPGKNSEAVMDAMKALHAEYGEMFSKAFKNITTDNGFEFEDFAQLQEWGTYVYFAHPYSSWERPVNERHNGLLRRYIPKGVSIEQYSPEVVLSFADELNGLPRRRLGYRTPEELFDVFLDSVYAV